MNWLRRMLLLFLALTVQVAVVVARPVEITLIHTTDLHGHIWPTKTYEGQADVGGFLRCAARIEQIRAEKPSSLLVDCGDTFQGSPESFLTRGRLLVDGLNQLRYDAWTLGNHEIDWGPRALRERHDQAEIPFLAANLYFQRPEENWLPRIKPYVIREVDGVRVAVVGLTTPGIPRWSRPHLLDGAMFRPSVETLAEILPAVKAERPDVLVVTVHQGYRKRGDDFANQIEAIAKAFPEIDVLLGGHTHTPVEDMRLGPVLYSQAGYHGIWLGRVTLVYDTVSNAVVEKRGALELMDAAIPFHEGLLQRWSNELSAARTELDLPLGETLAALDPAPDAIGRSTMQTLIGRAIIEGTGADLVLHGSLGEEAIPPGPLKRRDAWRIVPYENTIGLVSMTPQELREALKDNHARGPLTGQSLGPLGFSYEVRNLPDGSVELGELRDERGEPLHARKRYRVAFNSYVLASGGERYPNVRRIAELPSSRLDMLNIDTRQLVLDYLHRNQPLRAITPGRIEEP